MGSYAQCWLGDFYVGSSKNDVDVGLLSLFRATDRRVITDRAAVSQLALREIADQTDFEGGDQLIFYVAPISVVRDRLELMGYTLETCKSVLNECIRVESERIEEMLRDPSRVAHMTDFYESRRKVLQSLTADVWIQNLREIHGLGLEQRSAGRNDAHSGTVIGYMLEEDWYGYAGPDRNVGLRLAIEACPQESELLYDVSDLVSTGYVDPEEDLVAHALGIREAEYSSAGRIVILTEGRSDTWILSESLNVLFPHLADYFSFLDFEEFRVPGGSGNLANLTRAMAAARIVNKIVALFDNDTAGQSAVRTLSKLSLPENIRVLQLPSLDSLRAYPTIGPTGASSMDVNGIAGGIELYLGMDVLVEHEGGALAPVQWTGYDQGVGAYQGEVLRKSAVQDRFAAKLAASKADPQEISRGDWNGLRSVWSAIFRAFHDTDGADIRQGVIQYI